MPVLYTMVIYHGCLNTTRCETQLKFLRKRKSEKVESGLRALIFVFLGSESLLQ